MGGAYPLSGTSASDEAMASVRRRGKIDAEIHAEKVSRLLLSGGCHWLCLELQEIDENMTILPC